ncbi:MAG TPA: hypothetical protein GXX75_12935 [Clostridiales bacterium]|nr:hypothetical protein [Clostridiales bacterium]
MKAIRKIILITTIILGTISLYYIISELTPRILLLISTNIKISPAPKTALGIIGSADGPTSILLTQSSTPPILAITSILLTILGTTYLIKTKKPTTPKNKLQNKTSK